MPARPAGVEAVGMSYSGTNRSDQAWPEVAVRLVGPSLPARSLTPCAESRGACQCVPGRKSLSPAGDSMMALPGALLVSRTRPVVEAVQSVFDTLDHLKLEVCADGEQARREVTRENVVLVL